MSTLKFGNKEVQDKVIASDILPITRNVSDEQLISLGFVLGPKIDDYFIEGKIPATWKKVAGQCAWHIHLIDEKGRIRATLFADINQYSTAANMWVWTRFASCFYPLDKPRVANQVVIQDTRIIIKRIGISDDRNLRNSAIIRRKGKEWLNRHYPNWKDPTAYW